MFLSIPKNEIMLEGLLRELANFYEKKALAAGSTCLIDFEKVIDDNRLNCIGTAFAINGVKIPDAFHTPNPERTHVRFMSARHSRPYFEKTKKIEAPEFGSIINFSRMLTIEEQEYLSIEHAAIVVEIENNRPKKLIQRAGFGGKLKQEEFEAVADKYWYCAHEFHDAMANYPELMQFNEKMQKLAEAGLEINQLKDQMLQMGFNKYEI